jgi:hypothetical protein
VHRPSEEKSDDSKDRFYEELHQVYRHFSKYHMKILLGDFNAKVVTRNIFKPTIGNKRLQQDSIDNGVTIVNFAKSNILVVKSTMSPRRNINKYTWTSTDGKIHTQIGHLLIDRRWHSSVLDVRSFRVAVCDTDHYHVVAKVRERLAGSKQAAQKFAVERFSLRKLNKLEVRKQYQIMISNKFAVLQNLSDREDNNKENNKISSKTV